MPKSSGRSAAGLWLLIWLASFVLIVADCFFIDERQSPRQHEWNYVHQHEWRQASRECSGNAQSPINIQPRNVIVNNHLRLHFYNYNQFIKFKMQNAHHTIKMNPIESSYLLGDEARARNPKAAPVDFNISGDPNSSSLPDVILNGSDEDLETEFETTGRSAQLGRDQPGPSKGQVRGYGGQQQPDSSANEVLAYNGAPTIKLDWLDDGNNEYKLRDIHFHWGERRDNGSEHAIEGKRAAMEMHLVHIKHGLEKSKIGFTSDSVAVIAILVESQRKSNADFNPIVNALGRINMTDQPQEIEYRAIKDLLPSTTTNFYTYSGSLTTPPCYQVVNWIVMQDRLYLNAKQIEMFRNLYAPIQLQDETASETTAEHEHESSSPSGPQLIMPNIRQTQPLSNRTILASFSPYGRLEQIQIANSPQNSATSHLATHAGYLMTVIMLMAALAISSSKRQYCV